MTDAPGKTVILLDIDGTLLDVRGAGRQAFIVALRSFFGWDDDIAYISFAGATDTDVLAKICARHGHRLAPGEDALFFARLAHILDEAMRETPVHVYPGVRQLLHALSAREDTIVGLVTGNLEEGARIKLRHAGLHDHFVLGAFGCEHADRNRLAALALERARSATGTAPLRGIFLIGDTPADIAAAAAIGARSIAVATGKFTPEALREAGADLAVEHLADTEALLQWMGLPPV